MFRKKMSRGKSKRNFRHGTDINSKNLQSVTPMRGGFRL